jgi:hypothetical protein
MQATVVMLIALGGLGCANQAGDLPPIPPVAASSAGQPSSDVSPPFAAPPSYPVYSGGPFANAGVPDEDSFRQCVRNTFCSFFLGRDPGVPTARQIEAAYYSGQYNY